MTLADLVTLLTGFRPLTDEDRAGIAEDKRFEVTADAAERPEENQ